MALSESLTPKHSPRLHGHEKKIVLPDYTDAKSKVQIFNEFFVTKTANVRTLLATLEDSGDDMLCPSLDLLLTLCTSKLQCCRPTHFLEITFVTKASKTTYILDPIPTNLLRNLLLVLASVIVDLVNSSLATSVFPSGLKSTIIKPLLKKPGLDTKVLKNFRPVPNFCHF